MTERKRMTKGGRGKMIINVSPVPKGRPRVGKYGNVFTPQRTRTFEAEVKTLLRRNMVKSGQWIPTDKPVELNMMFVYERDADLDNFVKAFLDSANGVLFKDDRQVVKIVAGKRKHAKGNEEPHIEYEVIEMGL